MCLYSITIKTNNKTVRHAEKEENAMTEMIDMKPMYNVPTDELLKKFPVENETPAVTALEKKVQNRLLNGFNTWNLGYDAWEHWGEVLYTEDSMYNVHGVRFTLGEYQMSMNVGLKVMDMQMGSFHNMLLSGDWTAIRYDVTSTDRRTGESTSGTVTEFVKFADYGMRGAKVVEGWGGVKTADYDGMQHFTNDAEKAAQKSRMERILTTQLPETDNLEEKYAVLYPTAIPEGRGQQMKAAVLKLMEAWNKGEADIDTYIDENLTADGSFNINDVDYSAEGLKERSHATMKDVKEKRVQINNILVSADWAACHYWAVIEQNGKKDVRESMEFFHFKNDLKIDKITLNTTPLV